MFFGILIACQTRPDIISIIEGLEISLTFSETTAQMIKRFPDYDPSLKNQKEQTHVTDEELKDAITPVKCTTKERLIQLLLFILGFGWLRLIALIVASLAFFLLMFPIVLMKHHITTPVRIYGFTVARIYIRIVAWCLGVSWVKRVGKRDPRARVSFFNHQSVLDGPIIWVYKPFRVVGTAGLKKVPFFGSILEAADTFFVDRSQSGGQAKIMSDLIEDKDSLPLAMAPEGKTTKGHFMLDFRTGGFLTKQPYQPVTLRYHEFFAFAGVGHSWAVGGLLEFFWRTLCTPLCFVEMHYLPLVEDEETLNLPAKEKARKCQLMMANDLGLLASDRSSKDIFSPKDPAGKKKD